MWLPIAVPLIFFLFASFGCRLQSIFVRFYGFGGWFHGKPSSSSSPWCRFYALAYLLAYPWLNFYFFSTVCVCIFFRTVSQIFPLLHMHLIFTCWPWLSFPNQFPTTESASNQMRGEKNSNTHTHMHRIRIGPTMPIIQFNVTMMVYRFSSGWHARFWNI